MAKESYIERLQREKQELVEWGKAMRDWKEAVNVFRTTGRKGSAAQEVVRTEKIEEELYQKIKQHLEE